MDVILESTAVLTSFNNPVECNIVTKNVDITLDLSYITVKNN